MADDGVDPSTLKVAQLKSLLASHGFEEEVFASDQKKATLVELYTRLVLPIRGQQNVAPARATHSAQKRAGIEHQYPTPKADRERQKEDRTSETPRLRSTRSRTPSVAHPDSVPAASTAGGSSTSGGAVLSSHNVFQAPLSQRPAQGRPARSMSRAATPARYDRSASEVAEDAAEAPAGGRPVGWAWPVTAALLGLLLALAAAWAADPCALLQGRPLEHGQCGKGGLVCEAGYQRGWLPTAPCVADPRYVDAGQWRALLVAEAAQEAMHVAARLKGLQECKQGTGCVEVPELQAQLLDPLLLRLHPATADKELVWDELLERARKDHPGLLQEDGTALCAGAVQGKQPLGCWAGKQLREVVARAARSMQAAVGLSVVLVAAYSIYSVWAAYCKRREQQQQAEDKYVRDTVRDIMGRLAVEDRLVIAQEKERVLPITMVRAERTLGLRLWPQVEELLRSTAQVRVRNDYVDGHEVKVWRWAGPKPAVQPRHEVATEQEQATATLYPTW